MSGRCLTCGGPPTAGLVQRDDGSYYWQCHFCQFQQAREAAEQAAYEARQAGDSGDSGDSISTPPRRTRWTAAELLAEQFPEPRWAIPGLVAEGLTLFVGAPKVGKSWLLLGLGVAVATGGRALGRIPVEQGDALYLALEDRPRRLQERLRKMLAGGQPPGRLTIELACPPLASGGETLITEWIKEHPEARLIMVDVLARVRGAPPPGMSAYDADYLAVAHAKQLADDHGVAIMVAHHDRKLKADDWLDSVSGTHGLSGAADTVVVLSRPRGEADGHLRITGRDVDEAEYALRFDPSLAQWNLLEGPAIEHVVSDTRAAILRFLREYGPARPKQIADATQLDHDLVKKTVQRMADDGQLDTDGAGTYFLIMGPRDAVPGVPLSPKEAHPMSILDKMTMRELQFIQAAFIGRLMERHRMDEEEATKLAGEFISQGRVSCEERVDGRLVGFFLDDEPLVLLTWERLRRLAAMTPMIGEDLDKKIGEE